MGQRHRRLVTASCGIWLLAIVAFVSCQNAPDVDELRNLATEGDVAAQFDLGDKYLNGEGVPQDNTEAARWFRLAADQGHARAQASLGFMYGNGDGVPRDDGEAARWYRLAADQGHAGAQSHLGVMYRNGRGVPQDDGEALRWYRLAAAQGHEGAQFNLGLTYSDGRGVPQDNGEAARWFRLAADQGHADAQYFLGLLHGAGQGVPRDFVAAHRWANLAAAQGHENARGLRDTLADELTETSKNPEPCTPMELSPAAVELVQLYEELQTFKDDTEFLDMGFSRAGPYYAWMEAVEAQQDRTEIELLDEVGFLPSEVMMLGMDYISEDPSESTLSAIEHWETRIQAGLARAKCAQPGTAVQDIARASAEARRAYVQPLARPPEGADELDERVVNPCIAAMMARNPELNGLTPWEIRSSLPEVTDPIVAQIRELAAPVLAELGDNARARNSLLDRFRGDCIRGARGETEPLDWSEAEVRELLSSSLEQTTKYEIPLLNVNGEPYFPGEQCDSPWVKLTPITADTEVGRHLSDTGWLCESTTPRRFCHTLEGERGWEQGFFTCSSSERSNAYWLQEWERSQ